MRIVRPVFITNFYKQNYTRLHLLADKWLSASDKRKNAGVSIMKSIPVCSVFSLSIKPLFEICFLLILVVIASFWLVHVLAHSGSINSKPSHRSPRSMGPREKCKYFIHGIA